MAEFSLDGRKTVKGLKADFKETFGATLRVYTSVNCKQPAPETASLASLRAEGAKGGSLKVGGNMQVGTFGDKVAEMYGIGVRVADKANKSLVPKDITLVAAGKL